jgi:hypothetical protein
VAPDVNEHLPGSDVRVSEDRAALFSGPTGTAPPKQATTSAFVLFFNHDSMAGRTSASCWARAKFV